MKRILLTCLLLAPLPAFADNYATCLLDKLPGVQNNYAAVAARKLCLADHPGGIESVEWGSGRGFFSKYDSVDECFFESARATQAGPAAIMIKTSCMRLYGDSPASNYFDQFDAAK